MQYKKEIDNLKEKFRASLVVQWNQVPIQGTEVQYLVQEDPTRYGTTKPVYHDHRACAPEPWGHDHQAPLQPPGKPGHPTAQGTQWEACAPRGLPATTESSCTATKA